MTDKEWRDNNPELAKDRNMRDYTEHLKKQVKDLRDSQSETINEIIKS